MKKWKFILGIDVSKKTLDIHCAELNAHIQIVNGSAGFKILQSWCRELGICLAASLVAMEYTGGYEYKLVQFCISKQILYTRLPGLAVKNSMGIVRGKNDKVDAKRIAQYASEKGSDIKITSPVSPVITMLRQYLSFRKRLVRDSAGFKATLKERKVMYECRDSDILVKMMLRKIKENESMVTKIEEQMEKLVQSDDAILTNYRILRSVKGIGNVNALMTIAFTENFTSFTNPRAYAVYVGVIPFDYSSGTSIRGKKRVSHLANKELKQELNQAARSAILWNNDIKEYADRKMLEKPYKLVLNNVKFKLILRMFSLVARGEFYVDKPKKAA